MKYDVARAVVLLSVTELCTLALRGGDLDLRPGMSKASMLEHASVGTKVHRKLQAAAGVLYDAEVAMTNTTLFHGISFEVNGRADGVLRTEPRTVDEIKTVSTRAFKQPPATMHDAQVKCYAYFLCRERGLEQVQTRLTYYCTEDGKTRYLTETHSAESLRAFYEELLARVEYRARILIERETVLRPSVGSGRFPYSSVREGQDIMLRECYRDIRAGKRLFIEAPTGIGKTLSALYPAVRALGEGHIDKIFYLTAKAATRREAFRASAQIFAAGSHLRTVVLSAREQMCRNDAAKSDPAGISHHCNPFDCPYARGFYDKCADAICEALSANFGFPRAYLSELAEKRGICPYEFQLELSEFCDILICDYNYVFNPQVYLRRYFDADSVDANRYAFLVDEAHNLGDRACDMYSAELCDSTLTALWRQLPQDDEVLHKTLERLTVPMIGFRRLCQDNLEKDAEGRERGYYISRNPLEHFCTAVVQVRGELEGWLRVHRGDVLENEVYRLCAVLKKFEVVTEYYDDNFLTFITVEGDVRTIRLICLDPSRILEAKLGRAYASVLFSATLTPTDYFADVLGGGKGAIRLSLPSPFDPSHTCFAAVTGISTRFENRAKSVKRIAAVIAATASGKAGNYIVYFPSYDYMEQVLKVFEERYSAVPTVVQTRGMGQSEREHFLDAFAEDGKLRIGFCVLGGSFSEGVDLPGKRLIGTVIIGMGLPAISNERNILREHYDITRERGYDYAYTYPGMNRVLQAAGRVIRREDDRGVIVLVDDRYAEPRMQSLFPDHWSHIQYAGSASELAEIVAAFWSKSDKNAKK